MWYSVSMVCMSSFSVEDADDDVLSDDDVPPDDDDDVDDEPEDEDVDADDSSYSAASGTGGSEYMPIFTNT